MDNCGSKKPPYAASAASHAARLRTPWTSFTKRIPLAGRCATEEKGGGSPMTALLNNSSSTLALSMEATPMMHSLFPATDVTPLAHPLRNPPYVLSIVDLEDPLSQSCMLASSLREKLPAGECRAVDCPDLRLSHRGQEEEEEVGIHEHVNYSGAHALQQPVEAGKKKVVEVEKENMKEGKEKEGSPFGILSFLSEQCNNNNNNNNEGCEYIAHRGVCVADRYELLKVLGRGTCGVVVQALDRAAQPMPELCALKISNALPRFADAAVREADILRSLPRDSAFDALPRLLDHFSMCCHEALVLPLYGLNLKLLLRVNHFRPMPAPLVRSVAAQLIIALQALTDAGLMHTDVKPDNIVLFDHTDEPLPVAHSTQEGTRAGCGLGSVPSANGSDGIACGGTEVTSRVVLLDLSSAQFVPGQPGQPVQTIGYRAPETALGLVYGHPIDMWSLGCVVYELATGVPLFPVANNAELLRRHIAVLGPLPEELSAAKAEADRTATADTCGHMSLDSDRPAGGTLLELLHVKDTAVAQHTATAAAAAAHVDVDEPKNENVGDQNSSAAFSVLLLLDFLLGCLTWAPAERLTADEAAQHPYLAPYFASDSGEAMGDEKAAKDLSLSSRCSGMHFLRTHALTRDAPHLLARAKRQIEKQSFHCIAIPPRLNTRRSIRPMRYFTEHSDERHGSASDTALRVSVPHLGNRSSLGIPSEKEPTAYTATFFDPIERVQVSILSFEDFM